MQREAIRQRIQYLIEHGGLHQQEGPNLRQRAIFWLLVVVVTLQLVDLLR